MGKTKQSITNTTRVVNLLTMLGSIVAIAVLQDQIVKLGPQKSSAMDLQSWMTFFTLIFAFMGITEVYDETEVMIFKPKLYEKLYGAGREQRAAQDDEQ